MFAIIKAGARQYKVSKGSQLTVDYQVGKIGESLVFDQVLLIGGDKTTVGAPLVKGAKVTAKVTKHSRGPRCVIFKYKRRKNFKKTRSHRQPQTVLEVADITV